MTLALFQIPLGLSLYAAPMTYFYIYYAYVAVISVIFIVLTIRAHFTSNRIGNSDEFEFKRMDE